MKKRKLIYIFPQPSKKKLRFDLLAQSLIETFDIRILTENKHDYADEKIYSMQEYNEGNCEDSFFGEFPFSIIGVDRRVVDYSNVGDTCTNYDLNYYKNLISFIEYHIRSFQPTYMITHVADNAFSYGAAQVAKKLGIPCFVELMRPYWPERQVLVNPFTFDNAQIKRLVKIGGIYSDKEGQDKNFSRDDYDHASPYWTGNFPRFNVNQMSKQLLKVFKPRSYLQLYRKLRSLSYFEKEGRVSIPDKGVLFPLHFQPEAALLGTDNRYADQAALCQYISYNLPLHYSLLIKEHPAQNIRPVSFYKRLALLPNAILLPRSYTSKHSIQNSEIVIVFSGNAGYEALLAGKKVILLGEAYYSDSPNVFRYRYDVRLDQFMLNVIKAKLEPIKAVRAYMLTYGEALYKSSVHVDANTLNNNVVHTAGNRLNTLLECYEDNCDLVGSKV